MIQTFDNFIYPVLNILRDGKEHTLKSIIEELKREFSLTDEDASEQVKGGGETKLHNRTQWATTYLGKAGLLVRPKRGVNQITSNGSKLLATGITNINSKYLADNYPSFFEFAYGFKDKPAKPEEKVIAVNKTPSEIMKDSYDEIKSSLASEILEHIKEMSPVFFERLVLQLLLAMGYGNGENSSASLTPKSHDMGIDGIIDEDKLGLEKIYVQAKRYKDISVPREDIDKFIGALTRKGTRKGVFITTSCFVKGALGNIPADYHIVLVDGEQLANLMIEYNIGVSLKQTYEIKKIDTDFFSEE